MAPHVNSKEAASEKPAGIQLEDVPVDEKHIESGGEGDYSGAVKKTDPEEIKLVRKLDIRIMTILWAMYFLVSSHQNLQQPKIRLRKCSRAMGTNTTNIELSRPQRHHTSASR